MFVKYEKGEEQKRGWVQEKQRKKTDIEKI
jgi:hypothetical protein